MTFKLGVPLASPYQMSFLLLVEILTLHLKPWGWKLGGGGGQVENLQSQNPHSSSQMELFMYFKSGTSHPDNFQAIGKSWIKISEWE